VHSARAKGCTRQWGQGSSAPSLSLSLARSLNSLASLTLPLTVWNCILIAAFVSVLACTFGSWMKFLPRFASGGSSPVSAILMHSMIVVLPEPLLPTMSVSGLRNAMTCVATVMHMSSRERRGCATPAWCACACVASCVSTASGVVQSRAVAAGGRHARGDGGISVHLYSASSSSACRVPFERQLLSAL
jgi:hypothetical protein